MSVNTGLKGSKSDGTQFPLGADLTCAVLTS